jgi:hypothetical protein
MAMSASCIGVGSITTAQSRFGIDQNPRVLRRGDGDVGELHRGRVDHHRAVGKRHEPIVAHREIGQRHDEAARYEPRPRIGADAVQRGAHGLGGAVDGAPDAAVGVARAHHEGREIQGFARDLGGLDLRDPLGAAALIVEARVLGRERRGGGVDEPDALDGRDGLADQHRLDEAFARQTRRRLEHARVVALGKGDGLF